MFVDPVCCVVAENRMEGRDKKAACQSSLPGTEVKFVYRTDY
jgi:hypothetical protein